MLSGWFLVLYRCEGIAVNALNALYSFIPFFILSNRFVYRELKLKFIIYSEKADTKTELAVISWRLLTVLAFLFLEVFSVHVSMKRSRYHQLVKHH